MTFPSSCRVRTRWSTRRTTYRTPCGRTSPCRSSCPSTSSTSSTPKRFWKERSPWWSREARMFTGTLTHSHFLSAHFVLRPVNVSQDAFPARLLCLCWLQSEFRRSLTGLDVSCCFVEAESSLQLKESFWEHYVPFSVCGIQILVM